MSRTLLVHNISGAESLIEVEKGKQIRYHRTEFGRIFVQTYSNWAPVTSVQGHSLFTRTETQLSKLSNVASTCIYHSAVFD